MRRSVILAGIATLVGVAVCCTLGTWQLQRLHWKNALQAAIEARAYGEPVPLGTLMSGGGDTSEREYTRVRLRGYFDHESELRFWSPGEEGPGSYLVTPFHDRSGAVAYVNRGYVPEPRMDEAARPTGEVEIVGLARNYGSRNTFTPDNDTAENVWYWYDYDAMRAHMLDNWQRRNALVLLPVVIEAEDAAEGYPRGGVTRLELSNRHLEYVITWFGLALTLAAVFAAWAWQQVRAARRSGPDASQGG